MIEKKFINSKIKCLDNGVYLKDENYGSLVIVELEIKKISFIN